MTSAAAKDWAARRRASKPRPMATFSSEDINMAATRLRQLDEPQYASVSEPANPQPTGTDQAGTAALNLLLLSLKTVSQRALTAFASLFVMFNAAGVFYLWLTTLPNITTQQIVGLTIYSIFVLVLCRYGRR